MEDTLASLLYRIDESQRVMVDSMNAVECDLVASDQSNLVSGIPTNDYSFFPLAECFLNALTTGAGALRNVPETLILLDENVFGSRKPGMSSFFRPGYAGSDSKQSIIGTPNERFAILWCETDGYVNLYVKPFADAWRLQPIGDYFFFSAGKGANWALEQLCKYDNVPFDTMLNVLDIYLVGRSDHLDSLLPRSCLDFPELYKKSSKTCYFLHRDALSVFVPLRDGRLMRRDFPSLGLEAALGECTSKYGYSFDVLGDTMLYNRSRVVAESSEETNVEVVAELMKKHFDSLHCMLAKPEESLFAGWFNSRLYQRVLRHSPYAASCLHYNVLTPIGVFFDA